jgi:predicted Zn-dependent protease
MLTSFGRDQETAADGEGLRMAHAAGIDGSALARFFETLERAHGDVPDELAWLSSHPQLDERRAEVMRQWQQLGSFRAQPLEIDWDLVQRHARDPQSRSDPKAEKDGMDRSDNKDGRTTVDTARPSDEDGARGADQAEH